MSREAIEKLINTRLSLAAWDLLFPPNQCVGGLASLLESTPRGKHRKPNRSRRIVKKLLKRSEGATDFNRDAVSVDGGKRWVTAREVRQHGLRYSEMAK